MLPAYSLVKQQDSSRLCLALDMTQVPAELAVHENETNNKVTGQTA